MSNSGSISGGNCGEVLLPCYSRDVHQLPAELFTAGGVAGELWEKLLPPSRRRREKLLPSGVSPREKLLPSPVSLASTVLALVTCAGTFLRQPPPVAAPQPFRASRSC